MAVRSAAIWVSSSGASSPWWAVPHSAALGRDGSGGHEPRGATGTRHGMDVAGPDRLTTVLAHQDLGGDPTTAVVDDLEGRPVGCGVGVPPLAHGREHRPQVPALVRQPVVVPRRVLGVRHSLQYAGVDQRGQALLEGVARDTEALLEVFE